MSVKANKTFYLRKDNIYAVPILHYNMEMAAQVRMAFEEIQPDCVAVELAETMQLRLLHAASRLPDISVVITHDRSNNPLYYLCEPCEPTFEALRSALEIKIPAYCIDLDVDYYPEVREVMPDPYAIQRIGLKRYFECSANILHAHRQFQSPIDEARELHMARRLKELSLSYDRILFISGMFHTDSVLNLVDRSSFPENKPAQRNIVELCTLTPESCRDVMAEFSWTTQEYETWRENSNYKSVPDRQKIYYHLLKAASSYYLESTGNKFPGYNMRNIMKFSRNYALINQQLMPDLFQLLSSAKGCVDHNYAYEVWSLATDYPYLRNIDNLPELPLSVGDVWGHSKLIRFHLKQPSRKSSFTQRKKDKSQFRFKPPGMFSICSYPPEDLVIERFGEFLKKKGTQILSEESARVIPFSNSIQDGVDTKETIRHWHEHKLYVKIKGKPPGAVGSVVVIFDEDLHEESMKEEKYPWITTWLGEHQQESDMAFYATPVTANVVGPGISRCEYGGFMMSYPPRRLMDIWSDPDYQECRSKSEVLLAAAIDYAVTPLIVYVAAKPPRSLLKSFAKRFGKKIVYIPIGQLSPITLNKIRAFHVLDGYDKRSIAGEYIF